MTCVKHPETEAAGMCICCGKPYCKDCLVEVNGKMYCRDDLNKEFAKQESRQAQQASPQYQTPQVIINNQNTNTNNNAIGGAAYAYKHKSKGTAIVFCLLGLIGFCGLHRFYVGKIGTGLIWLFTLGFFGIGQIIDFIILIAGGFRDNAGQHLV